MSKVNTSSFINVREKLKDLELSQPQKLAFLPKNINEVDDRENLIYDSSVTTIKKIFHEKGIDLDEIENDELEIPELQQNAFEWIGPIVFISASYYSQNPDAINVAVGLISDYLKDFFKGIPGSKKVKLSVVREIKEDEEYTKIDYEGDLSGLSELENIIKAASNE